MLLAKQSPFEVTMHPVLRQMKPPVQQLPPRPLGYAEAGDAADEGEGIARIGARPETHPRVHMKKDSSEAYVPSRNVLRDQDEAGEGGRHLKYTAGKALQGSIDSSRVLEPDDFEVDQNNGVSSAGAHLAAADLVTAYEQTVREESNFQKTFNNNVRTLISRHETVVGLMHLWDFISAFIDNPASKALTAQLFLIVQHSRDEGILRETLLNIADPSSRWLVDLVNILQSIVVQERSLSLPEKVAAVNYSVITISKHYARKIYKTPFVPLDKEAKISTFYMRVVIKLLVLSDDLGMYRNERMQRVVSSSRQREMSDQELMFSLRRALAGHESDDDAEDEVEDEYYDDGLEDEDAADFSASSSSLPWSSFSQPGIESRGRRRAHHEAFSAQPGASGSAAEPALGRRKLVRFA